MAKDLGLVTAYGYAQAGGYTGTEAEFEMMLANAGRGIVSVELTSTVGYVKTYTITFTDGTTTTFDVTDGEVSQAELDTKADAIVDSATGDIASITDGADDVPVKSLKVNIVPKQSGSGDPSPSNVRPITGWDEVEVYRTGVDVWDEIWELGTILPSNGQNYSSTTKIRSKNLIPVLPNTSYRLVALATTEEDDRIYYYDADKNYITFKFFHHGTSISETFTTPSNCRYVRFTTQGTTYNNDISINYPSTDHEYHSYQGTSYSIPLPSTVYGGEVDVTNGVLTDTMRTGDLGSFNWDYLPVSSSFPYGVFYTSLYWKKYGETNFVTDCYKLSNNDFSVDKATIGNAGGNTIYIMDSSFNGDTTAFKTSLNGRYMVYERKDPTEITLTPTQVTTLLGQNNIWADSGDVEVEYRADTKLYIDKKINALI